MFVEFGDLSLAVNRIVAVQEYKGYGSYGVYVTTDDGKEWHLERTTKAVVLKRIEAATTAQGGNAGG